MITVKDVQELAILLTSNPGKKYRSPIMPDGAYCVFDNSSTGNPFRIVGGTKSKSYPMNQSWQYTVWEEVKYQPKHGEVVLAWDDEYTTRSALIVFNKTGAYYHVGGSSNVPYDNYAPYTGEIPENMKDFVEKVQNEN